MRYLNLQLIILLPLLLDLSIKLLYLELNRVQFNEQLSILFSPLLYVILCTSLIFDSVDLECGDRPLHVPELPVEFLECLRVLLALAQVLVGGLRHHIVLV